VTTVANSTRPVLVEEEDDPKVDTDE